MDNMSKGKKKTLDRLDYKFERWDFLKLWWDISGKFFAKVIITIAFVFLFFLASTGVLDEEPIIDSENGINSIIEFPELEEPVEMIFQWEYEGEPYTISETLYITVYEYYGSQPKKLTYTEGDYIKDLEEKYWLMFLEVAEEDDIFSQIVSDIKAIGEKRGFSNDEILELAMAFVQSIPYDEAKAAEANALPRYPYEVLYDNMGVCSGKTFLAALLAQELEYGISLFDYKKENHISLGIKCTEEYSSYNSGYCHTETTYPNWRIGIISFKDIEGIEASETFSLESEPNVYQVFDGKTYEGIINTVAIIKEMKLLKQEIDVLDSQLKSLESELSRLDRLGRIHDYNLLVPQYNSLLSLYNQKVASYNNLTKRF